MASPLILYTASFYVSHYCGGGVVRVRKDGYGDAK